MLRKLTYVLVCQVVVSLAIGACSSAESTRSGSDERISPPSLATPVEPAEPTEEAGPPVDVVSRLIRKALRSEGSLSYSTLIQELGPPQRIKKEPVANQYVRGQIDTLRTLVYTGIEALLYDVTDDPKILLVRLSLSSTQYSTPEGLRVGLSEARALDELGPPTRRNESRGELIYEETESTPIAMVVRIQNGQIVRIDWEFYFA